MIVSHSPSMLTSSLLIIIEASKGNRTRIRLKIWLNSFCLFWSKRALPSCLRSGAEMGTFLSMICEGKVLRINLWWLRKAVDETGNKLGRDVGSWRSQNVGCNHLGGSSDSREVSSEWGGLGAGDVEWRVWWRGLVTYSQRLGIGMPSKADWKNIENTKSI